MHSLNNCHSVPVRLTSALFAACLTVSGVFFNAGCEMPPTSSAQPADTAKPPTQTLQAGDVIHIAFPGSANLDTSQQIRRDGELNLNLIGEIHAAGKTPAELEKELMAAYSSQLVSKEVKVTVVSSSFSVFVTGEVLKPGKIQPDHAITAFEAIMEAGGFDFQKANTRQVRIVRTDGDQNQTFTVDMQDVLDGKPTKPFYLRANDTVYVPPKFQLF